MSEVRTDYVEWCDSLAEAMADYAEQQGLSVHLHQFTGEFLASHPQLDPRFAEIAVISDSAEVLNALGVNGGPQQYHLKHWDIALLRDSYSRWLLAHAVPLDNVSVVLLGTLNRLSQSAGNGYTTVDRVSLEQIVEEASQGLKGIAFDTSRAEERLDDLKARGLAYSQKYSDIAYYKSSYLGVARTARTRVVEDQEIDALRTAGEGETLDFKRTYKLKSTAEKLEFAKDVTALANAGGAGPRYLLLGVEDDGTFFVPRSADEEAQHRQSLERIQEAQLQEIVTYRTTGSPSVRIAARGEHRDGLYVLIAITRDVSHLPYRVFQDQSTRTSPDAHKFGEVWVHKGSTKARATEAEIAALEQQASLYTRIRTAHPGDGS